MILELAVPDDVAAVAAIERDAFADPWSPSAFSGMLQAGAETTHFVVARNAAGEPPLGYVVAIHAAGEGEIVNLAVTPAARGRGMGSALVRAVLDEATRRGTSALYLEVRESNTAARRLYERHSFTLVGRRRGYYRQPDEDALVLLCRVQDSGHPGGSTPVSRAAADAG